MYHPCGDVANELLQEGLARVQDWSARFLPAELAATLRQSESRAKNENIRLWKDWVFLKLSLNLSIPLRPIMNLLRVASSKYFLETLCLYNLMTDLHSISGLSVD